MSDILIKSRITSPGLARGIIHRSRLTDLLKANIDKSLLLICTSAGFGKTTLANDFLTKNCLKHAWYYTTGDINSFYAFFNYIVHSFRNLSDDFGKNALELVKTMQKEAVLSKNYRSNINDCVATLVNEFMKHFKDDTFLVIDDLHNIDEARNGEWLNYFFDALFDNLPANLHLIITTRSVPQFNINKLKAKRRVFKLSSSDLIFDDVEITELLEREYSIHSTSDDIKILQSSIHGWITGIHLVLQAFGNEFRNFKPGRKKNFADIFNYFAKDIFENLEEKTSEFLLNTAILEDFTAEICDHLLNIDYSEKLINELLSKNIFIEISGQRNVPEDNANRYNYQELFRIFLLSKLRELKSKEEINSRFRKLFKYYLSKNEIILAVNYGLKAEEYYEVIPHIIKNYKMFFDKGNYDTLWAWIDLIPAEIVSTDPHLLYLTGLLHLYFRSDPERSLIYLDEALRLSSGKEDLPLLVNCNILKTETLLLLGKVEQMKDDLKGLLLQNIAKEDKVRLLYQISRVLYREGHEKYNEMIEILSDALTICSEENFKSLKAELYSMLGNIHSDWGDLVKAVHYYEQALDIDSNVFETFRALNNIVTQHCVLGNYVKAKEYLDRSIGLFNSFPSLLFKRYLLRSMYRLSFEVADFEESIRKLEELNALETKNSIKHYAGFQYMLIGEANYYLKNYDAALRNFEISLNNIDKKNTQHILINSYYRAKTINKVKVEQATERVFLEVLELFEKNNTPQDKVQLEIHLFDYYLKTGNTETALRYLKSSLEVSVEKHYVSFLEQEILNTRHAFDFAISVNLQKQFVRSIFQNVREKINLNWLSAEYKKRLALEIESLTDLKLFTFGKTEIWLRGILIDEEKWIRKKSKIILAYLLLNPKLVHTKERMMDMFFEEIPPEKADVVYHSTIYNIRTALKLYDIKSDAPKRSKQKQYDYNPNFILYEDKTLKLNPDFYYLSDNTEFERLYEKLMNPAEGKKNKINYSKTAVEMYYGDFMPGYYENWCEEMRIKYKNMYIRICEELIKLLEEDEQPGEVILYTEKLLSEDKLNNLAHVKLISAYSNLGNIKMAKTRFNLMLKIYDEELGEKPPEKTLNQIRSILGA